MNDKIHKNGILSLLIAGLFAVVVFALLISEPQYAPNSGARERLAQHLRSISTSQTDSSASVVVPFTTPPGTRYWVLFVPVNAQFNGKPVIALVPLSYSEIRNHAEGNSEVGSHLNSQDADYSAIAKEINLMRVPALEADGQITYVRVEELGFAHKAPPVNSTVRPAMAS